MSTARLPRDPPRATAWPECKPLAGQSEEPHCPQAPACTSAFWSGDHPHPWASVLNQFPPKEPSLCHGDGDWELPLEEGTVYYRKVVCEKPAWPVPGSKLCSPRTSCGQLRCPHSPWCPPPLASRSRLSSTVEDAPAAAAAAAAGLVQMHAARTRPWVPSSHPEQACNGRQGMGWWWAGCRRGLELGRVVSIPPPTSHRRGSWALAGTLCWGSPAPCQALS